MLEDAVRIAKTRKLVYVVANNAMEAKHMAHMLEKMEPTDGIRIVTPSMLPEFDMEKMRLCDSNLLVEVLVDHHYIEARWPKLVEMLTRYDAPHHNPTAPPSSSGNPSDLIDGPRGGK